MKRDYSGTLSSHAGHNTVNFQVTQLRTNLSGALGRHLLLILWV
jgi:hypothetical protein